MKRLITLRIIIICSFLDAFCTDIGIAAHQVTEGNPVAALLYNWSIIGFYAWKIALPLTLLMVYRYLPKKRLYGALIGCTAGIYVALCLYHGLWITWLLV